MSASAATRRVLDVTGQEGLAHGDRVQRLPQQLDLAVFGHETTSEQVMDGSLGRPPRESDLLGPPRLPELTPSRVLFRDRQSWR